MFLSPPDRPDHQLFMSLFLKKIPPPLAGVSLAIVGLGLLLEMYGMHCSVALAILSSVLLALPLLSFICNPTIIRTILRNAITASLSGTISMAIMLQSIVLKPYAPTVALIAFIVGAVLHLFLVVWFTVRFLFIVPFAEMRGSWFILYAGAASFSIASPYFGMQKLGNIVAWISLAIASVLIVLVTIRYLKYDEVEPIRPLACILAAPASICLVGLFQSNTDLMASVPVILIAVVWLIFLGILPCTVRVLTHPFYPSFAALTFPFVISASAGRRFFLFAEQQGMELPFFCSWLVYAQLAVAVCLTGYVFIRYIILLGKAAVQP